MNFEVITAESFDRALKPLVKKYPSLKQEVAMLGEGLASEPAQGTSLGKNCYKIRLSIKSKGKGKSGGARVITCVVAVEERVILLTIYDKSEQDTILDKDLQALLDALK
ncbi:MAG: type II toxin-antitoxin system RelE/ParE family toxin [Cytophagaceae bacterium]|nr:type II toxin-antitoxin system RelE/ParE family toxin [Cytophagaceae bacterium]